jgi:hypothetical protein
MKRTVLRLYMFLNLNFSYKKIIMKKINIPLSILLVSFTSCLVVGANTSLAEEIKEGISLTSSEVQKLMNELKAQKEDLGKKEQELDEQKKLLDKKVSELDKTLDNAEKLLKKYENPVSSPGSPEVIAKPQRKPSGNFFSVIGDRIASFNLSQMRGTGTEEVGVERKSEKQKKPDVPSVAVDSGGVLLPKGRFVLEPALKYSRTSALRVAVEGFTIIPAINVGLFDISEIDRDILTASITGRVGVTDRLEIEAYIPYLWRDDSTIGRPIGVGSATNTLSSVQSDGIGDIELAAHYQINDGTGGWPYFIGNLRYKATTGKGPFEISTDPNTGLLLEAPTGSGFNSFQPSVTMLRPSDPVIFFANLGYTYNMKESYGGTTGEIDPGNSINSGIGMGFSVNDESSFSLGYSHSVVFKTEQNGQAFANSDKLQVGTASFGFSHQLTDRVGVNFNLGYGVTDDAPDMQVGVRVPIKFDLF